MDTNDFLFDKSFRILNVEDTIPSLSTHYKIEFPVIWNAMRCASWGAAQLVGKIAF